jgi:hypothetical protein
MHEGNVQDEGNESLSAAGLWSFAASTLLKQDVAP